MKWIKRNAKLAIPAAVVILGALAWLGFGFFGVHLLFVDDEVSEAPPVFAASGTSATAPATTAPVTTPITSTVVVAETSQPPPVTVTVAPEMAPITTVAEPAIVTEYGGTFVGRDHPTSGSAIVLGDTSGQRFLRFESFETDNGPDLNVYLVNSSAGGVNDFVDLGDLKGNVGEQNYEIPIGTDLELYNTVLIWCVRFSSPFGEASLSAA
jgi:hypothetical protein